MLNQMVVSTEIKWIGYEEKQNMLQVEFIEGGIYQYSNVPKYVFEDFLNAESHGCYLEQHIKGRYPYRKVR